MWQLVGGYRDKCYLRDPTQDEADASDNEVGGMQLRETYFKDRGQERAPGPQPAQAIMKMARHCPRRAVPEPGLKLSVRQTGVAAPPDLSVPAGKQDPAPEAWRSLGTPHFGKSKLCPSLGPRTGSLITPTRLARPAAEEAGRQARGRLEAPLRRRAHQGAPKCWGDDRAEQIAGTCRAGLGAGAGAEAQH